MSLQALGHSHLLVEALHWVLALELLQLFWSVLVQELVDGEEATTDTDVDLVIIDLDHHSLAAELVNALTLAHEHNLQLLALWVVVDVLSNLLVDLIVLYRDVHRDSRLQVDDVVLQILDLVHVVNAKSFTVSQLFQDFEGLCAGQIELILELVDEVLSVLQLGSQFVTLGLAFEVSSYLHVELRLNVDQSFKFNVELSIFSLQEKDLLSLLADCTVQLKLDLIMVSTLLLHSAV